MSLSDAREAIYERAAFLAKDAAPADLNVLAEAIERVAYGPQGAITHYRYMAESKTRSVNEQHHHHHDDRPRAVGFGGKS
jgi:hypothetical protein